jgi:hypothetical protein
MNENRYFIKISQCNKNNLSNLLNKKHLTVFHDEIPEKNFYDFLPESLTYLEIVCYISIIGNLINLPVSLKTLHISYDIYFDNDFDLPNNLDLLVFDFKNILNFENCMKVLEKIQLKTFNFSYKNLEKNKKILDIFVKNSKINELIISSGNDIFDDLINYYNYLNIKSKICMKIEYNKIGLINNILFKRI